MVFLSDELTDQEMSSSTSEEEKYDVFLSFRGVDTRENFTSHLYAALCRKKIETYIDYRLERGDEISPALLKAIEASKLCVIIFSENYGNSSWCLDELVHILKCKKTNAQFFVVPVFYKIDPSNVRKQKGSFEAAFIEHEKRFKDKISKVKEWRQALEDVANLSGWDSAVTRPESKLVDSIVLDILKKLSSISATDDSKGLVGIDKRVDQTMSLLGIGSLDVRVLGLWGMGGIGKTTLADTIFNRLFHQFDGCCFLTNVREESEKHGLNHLRNKLLSALLEEDIPSTIVARKAFDKKRLRRKRVLIVLDDVNDPEQLDTLVGDQDWFGPGSRIIVTSRDEQVLQNANNVHFYEVKKLNREEALQLFHLNAFKSNSPPENDFLEMSLMVVDYANGIPLALKILGSYLFSKSKLEWEKALNKLKTVPNVKVQNVLRISYDGLDQTEKDIFLDIACFFKGEERDLVEKILDGCDLFADVGIPDLIKKSLVTVEENKVLMHDLLQEMGWEIVRQQSKELGKRSRLWIAEDVYRMLKTNTGSASIEGIFLDMSKIKDTDLNPTVFAKMYNLRLLKVYNSNEIAKKCTLHFPKGLKSLPDALRYLHWYEYPLNCFPTDFSPENLVVLEIPNSQVEKLWDEDQYLDKLRKIDLSNSKKLTQFPDLSQFPHLESLNLQGYRSLVQVPSYFHKFSQLTYINLSGNSNLKALTDIPQSVQYLNLEDTGIQELPSIGSLENLVTLVLRNCKELKSLSNATKNLSSLDYLNLHGCSSFGDFPELPMNIKYLNLNGTAIEQVPSEIEDLWSLQIMDLGNCKRLKTVPRRTMTLTQNGRHYNPDVEEISFLNCLELDEKARENVMAYAQLRILRIATASLRPGRIYESQVFVCCPGSEIPKWFGYQSEGSSITIKLPYRWFNASFLGFALSAVVGFEDYKDESSLMFRSETEFRTNLGECFNFETELMGWIGDEDWGSVTVERLVNSNHVFLWYDYSLNLNFMKDGKFGEDLCTTLHNAAEATFEFSPIDTFKNPVDCCYVKKCGVSLVYSQDSSSAMDEDIGEAIVSETGKGKRLREESGASGSGTIISGEEPPKHKRA